MLLKKHRSLFLAKIRPPLEHELKSSNDTLQSLSKSQSPDSFTEKSHDRKKYNSNYSYSCFTNPSNTKIHLNTRCLSGNLLNRSLNARLLSETETVDFDLVLEEYFPFFINSVNFHCLIFFKYFWTFYSLFETFLPFVVFYL